MRSVVWARPGPRAGSADHSDGLLIRIERFLRAVKETRRIIVSEMREPAMA